MKKKLMAAALTGAMALSLAAPAFAASETVVTATYSEPVIEVSVPTTATAVINPYGLPCKFTYDPATGKTVKAGTEGAVDFALKSDAKTAVATQPMILVNYGETALKVFATPTVTIKSGSDLAITADKVEEEEGKKAAKSMTIQVAGAEISGAEGSWSAETKKLTMDAALATAWGTVDWTDSSVKKTDSLAITKDKAGTAVAGEEKELGELAAIHAAKTTEGATDDEKAVTVRDNCMLAVTVLSDAVKKPSTDWTAKDVVTLKIAYTFEVNA